MARAALVALALLGCSSGAELERLGAEAEPHLERFERFDRWARRLDLGDPGFGSEGELREAAFSPLRAEPGQVVAAWLDREGAGPRSLAWPAEASPITCGWGRIRDARLGEIEVCTSTLVIGRESHEVVAVRRSLGGAGGGVLRVTVAFARP